MGEKDKELHQIYAKIPDDKIKSFPGPKKRMVNVSAYIGGKFSFEFSVKLSKRDMDVFQLGRAGHNNWRKYHGLPMRRRKWLRQ